MPQEPVRYVSLNEAAQQYLTQNPDVSEYFNTKLDRDRFGRQYGVTTPEDFALWHYANWGKKENRMFPSYGGMFSGNNQAAPQPTPMPGPGPKSFIGGLPELKPGASPSGMPSWVTPPSAGSPVTQAFTQLTNPVTGETWMAPSGGYRVNV